MIQHPTPADHKNIDGMSIGGRAVLAPKTQITHENCHELEEQINDAVQRNKIDIIFDCKHVGLLDSAALQLLLQTHDELRSKGGALKIVGLNDVCRDILMATRLINVFFVYKDIHEAVTNTI
jgi:anti-anti-sigma factor